MLGLLKAVERFDPDRGNRLATYATWWIRSSMLAAISASPTIRLPAARTRQLAAILRTERELAGAGRPRPGSDLVADRTGVPLSQVERLRTAPHVVASLDAHLAGTDATLAELVADPGVPEMTADIDRDEARRALRAALSRLAPRVRRVLTLRFGLDGAPELSHDEISGVLGVSAERSRQLEVEGLRRLRPLAERASLAA
jgi:RNA polymerase sigma factor (sigma-70 family)